MMKYDCIMPLGNGSLHDNLEARICVASLRKFFPELGRIIVVGEDPGIEGVEVVRCPEPGAATKDGNIIGKISLAIKKCRDLSPVFLAISDDTLITRESHFEDFAPRYVAEWPDDPLWSSERMKRTWEKRLVMTLEKFGPGAKFFEPHIFSPMNALKFAEMCWDFDYMQDEGVIYRSLYYNYTCTEGVPVFDHAFIREPGQDVPDVRHISYTDRSFEDAHFRNKLCKIVSL